MADRITFIVRGVKQGKPVTATVDASSEASARNKATNAGILIESVEPKTDITISPSAIPSIAQPVRTNPIPQQIHMHAHTTPAKGVSGFGVAALVLGIVACIVAWVPFLGLLAIPVAGIGIVLAAVGAIVSLSGNRSGVGMPVAGGVVCGVAILVAMISTGGTAASISAAVDEADKKSKSQTAISTVSQDNSVFNQAQQTKDETPKAVVPPQPKQIPADSKQGIPTVMSDGSIVVGDTKVQIIDSSIGLVSVESLGEEKTSSKPFLKIKVAISNSSKTKRLKYSSWMGADFSFGVDYATLADEHGNSYQRINFGFGTDVEDHVSSANINPGDVLTDTLVFEAPIDAANTLTLELPGKNIGADDATLKFEIDVAKARD